VRLVAPVVSSTVRAVLQQAASASPTYDGPEALSLGAPPAGFALHRYDVDVGRGRADLDRGRDGLRNWAAHRVAGVRIHPPSTPVSLGCVYVVTLGTPLLAIAAPCVVTRVTDEGTHWGFSYRTLHGHPEIGEEAFDVWLDASDEVRFGIVAVSRHAGVLMGLAGPAARLVQRRVTVAYGRSLRDAVRSGAA
jgi:uncharacterized protein (UPF0548 family)